MYKYMEGPMITVNGANKSQKDYVESMAVFVCQYFNISPELEINLTRMGSDSNCGYCCHLEDNEFEIEVKRGLRLRSLLTTVAHELVHVKQYITGELTQDSDKNISYWDRPSEIEAHGRETGLFIQWAEANGYANKKWAHVCQ